MKTTNREIPASVAPNVVAVESVVAWLEVVVVAEVLAVDVEEVASVEVVAMMTLCK